MKVIKKDKIEEEEEEEKAYMYVMCVCVWGCFTGFLLVAFSWSWSSKLTQQETLVLLLLMHKCMFLYYNVIINYILGLELYYWLSFLFFFCNFCKWWSPAKNKVKSH
ncbi:hypothetical protein ACOSQ2_013111 [Xanthoceras sorbifolium]